MKKLLFAAFALFFLGSAAPVLAQTPPNCGDLGNGYIRDGITSCGYLMKVNPDGSINVSGSGGSGATVTATAAAPAYVEGSTNNPLSSDLHGGLRTTVLDANGVAVDYTVPVTVTGTGTAGTAAAGVVTVQGIASGTVLPVSAASLPLPTGAATSALQSGVQAPTAPATATATSSVLGGCTYTLAGVTFTNGQQGSLSCGANGGLYVAGTVASGATDSGNPLKIGGVYNSTLPTFTNGQRGDLQIGTRGSLSVTLFTQDGTLPVATQATSVDTVSTSGNVTKLGAVTFPLTFNGSSYDRQRSIAGSFGSAIGVQAVEQAGVSFSNMTSATTTTVKSGAGILHKIVVNTVVASATITIYDNTAGSGTKIGTVTLPSTITSDNPFTLNYDLSFATGLTLVTSGATDLTITYR